MVHGDPPGQQPLERHLGPLVEVDESEIPYRTRDDPVAGGQGRSHVGKLLVVGAGELSKDGHPRRIRLEPLADFTTASLTSFVERVVERGVMAISDGLASYRSLKGHRHNAKVVGSMAAHVVLPGSTASSRTSGAGCSAPTTASARSTWGGTSMSSSSAGTQRRHVRAAFDTLLGLTMRLPHASYRDIVALWYNMRPTIVGRSGAGHAPGASKGSKTFRVAVRTSLERKVGLVRNPDGGWMTVPFVDLIVVVTPSAEQPNCAEVLGFAPQAIIEAIDDELAVRKRRNPDFSPKAPIFVALDPFKRGKAVTQGLKECRNGGAMCRWPRLGHCWTSASSRSKARCSGCGGFWRAPRRRVSPMEEGSPSRQLSIDLAMAL